MRYLLSSILVLVIVSCASYSKKNGFTEIEATPQSITNLYFGDASKDYVYKANIEAFSNSFSGIFIVKKLGSAHHRIAFTTEMGNKIFDFTFQGKDFKVNYILKKMDKKILLNILKNDFSVLVKEHPSLEKVFQKEKNTVYKTDIGGKKYYYFSSEESLNKIVRVKNRKEKVEFTFSEINDNIAEKIDISHQNFDLKVTLKAL